MKHSFAKISAVLLLVVMVASPQSGFSQDFKTPWLEPAPEPAYTKWRKLGRGASNFFLGWTEIAYQPFRMADEGERWPVAAFGGIGRGLFYGIGRMATGLYEVIFFPFENPGGSYRPLIEPETPIPKRVRNQY